MQKTRKTRSRTRFCRHISTCAASRDGLHLGLGWRALYWMLLWWCSGNANLPQSGRSPKAVSRTTTAGRRKFQTRNRIRKWFTRNARLFNSSTRSWKSWNPCFDRHSLWLTSTSSREQRLAPCWVFHLGLSRHGFFEQGDSSWIGPSGLLWLPFTGQPLRRANYWNVRDSRVLQGLELW